jgi:hypothetical protein
VCLCAAGAPGYLAATVVNADGETDLVLAEYDSLGDPDVRYDSTPPPHEGVGPLPLEYARRVTASCRRHHPKQGRRP